MRVKLVNGDVLETPWTERSAMEAETGIPLEQAVDSMREVLRDLTHLNFLSIDPVSMPGRHEVYVNPGNILWVEIETERRDGRQE